MLINLSNHPLSSWSEYQISTAEKYYGRIIDLPFPQISPDADANTVKSIAVDYKDKCIAILSESRYYRDEINAVHTMGEMTFCFALVNELSKNNVTCIASTTERISNEENGVKFSKFKFVQFRKYIP